MSCVSPNNIKTYLFSIGQASSLPEKSFEISVYYKDSTGKDSTGTEDDNPFNFEFGNWENTSQFISPQKDDMASAIERVASNIESMENHNVGNDNAPWGSHLVIVETLKKIADALDRISKNK